MHINIKYATVKFKVSKLHLKGFYVLSYKQHVLYNETTVSANKQEFLVLFHDLFSNKRGFFSIKKPAVLPAFIKEEGQVL